MSERDDRYDSNNSLSLLAMIDPLHRRDRRRDASAPGFARNGEAARVNNSRHNLGRILGALFSQRPKTRG